LKLQRKLLIVIAFFQAKAVHNKELLTLKDACLMNVLKIYQIKVAITKRDT
jgi:hypothetical protein